MTLDCVCMLVRQLVSFFLDLPISPCGFNVSVKYAYRSVVGMIILRRLFEQFELNQSTFLYQLLLHGFP